jgi:hypothetical protein
MTPVRLLTSHPQPGYVFASHVPPTSSLFSINSKFRMPNFRMICTARPRPLMPAPMIKTSVSNDILLFSLSVTVSQQGLYGTTQQCRRSRSDIYTLPSPSPHTVPLPPHSRLRVGHTLSHITMNLYIACSRLQNERSWDIAGLSYAFREGLPMCLRRAPITTL